MITEKIFVLSKVKLFSDLTIQELRELAEDFEWEKFDKYSDIAPQGETPYRFYVLAEGKAEVLINKQSRNTLQINNFSPGDTFGEISLFTGNPAPTTIRCTENCRVLVMNSENFARMLTHWPKLYGQFLEKLSHRLNQANAGIWEARYKELLRSGLQANQIQYKFYGLWGSAKTTKEVNDKIDELSQSSKSLLIIGERGTGRQMVAWYLHKNQFGESAPFIVIDGLHFDHQWGDLVEPVKNPDFPSMSMSSLLDIAGGGTLFIRDINMISARTQLQLAKIISCPEKNCRVVGSIKLGADKSPAELTPQLQQCFTQRFEIVPLRKRRKDILVIAQGILDNLSQRNNRITPALNFEATKLLLSHDFRQGNITELIQVIERAFFLVEDNQIGREHLFFGQTPKKLDGSFNLLSWERLEKFILNKKFPLPFQKASLLLFTIIILSLLLAPETKFSRALFIIVWGLWWPTLAILSPLVGRFWCSVCPFSYTFELVQNYFHLNRTVPSFLKKYDYISITFLFLLIVWLETILGIRSNPFYTSLLLIVIMLFATIVGVIFARHSWCKHLCPLGGFIGLASIGAMLEVRADPNICLSKCVTYECYRGKETSPGCPTFQYAPYVDNNLDCKLCLRCIQNCPNGSAKLNLRFPAREVWSLTRVNQGFVIFIGAALAILLPLLYFEQVRESRLPAWELWFSLAYWLTALIAGLITWLLTRPFITKTASRRIKLVFALIPMVLAGHIIFHLYYVPGINAVNFGLILNLSGMPAKTIFLSALTITRGIAIITGLILSGFTVIMVLVRTREKEVAQG